MIMNFNKVRYIDLLTKAKKLEQQNRFLSDAESLELLKYRIDMEVHVFFVGRDKLISLIKNFLSKTISNQVFCNEIIAMHYQLLEKENEFELNVLGGIENCDKIEVDQKQRDLLSFHSDLSFLSNLYNDYLDPDLWRRDMEQECQRLHEILD